MKTVASKIIVISPYVNTVAINYHHLVIKCMADTLESRPPMDSTCFAAPTGSRTAAWAVSNCKL
eukprot:scaffold507262_cov20-Prasinocladus_malaysianus.AAC.1